MRLIVWIFLAVLLVGFVSANSIKNPGFDGASNWKFYTNGKASFTAVGAATVAITTKGTNTQLYQYDIPLSPNTAYNLSFKAKSDKAGDMTVRLLKHGSPYTNYGISGWKIDLTNSWKEFKTTFKTTSSAGSDARLMFWLIEGIVGEKYWIDDVVLESATVTPPSPTSDWRFYTNGKANFDIIGSVEILQKGTNTQLYQFVEVQPNTEYKLTFKAKSDKVGDMQVSLQKHDSPYTNYGLSSMNIDLTNAWKDYQITFKTNANAANDARLMFWLVEGVAGEKYWIDDVNLVSNGVSPPPTSTSINVYNTPSSPVNGDTVTVTATTNKAATIKLYIDNALVKTCTAVTLCEYSKTYSTGTYTYYATAEASPLVRDPISGTKSFTVTADTPPPSSGGKVFREFYATMSETTLKDWRVTDPLATATGSPNNNPKTYLPNSKLYITVNDLTQATSAEAIIDYWGGHVGTSGQKIMFNSKTWLSVPQLTSLNGIPSGHYGECYTQAQNVQVGIPINNLKVGSNMFEGTSGGQRCHSFNWGQWGWYGMVLRVYYDASKPHPSGSITSPSNNGVIGENPTITVQATSPVGIEKVEVIAYYDGPDYDGDGIYKEWQESYRKPKSQSVIVHQFIVGTSTTAPYSFVWDTSMVPDQAAGAIKLKARIKDKNGVWYETNEITGLTLSRSGSVKLYKATSVPERFWVNKYHPTMSSTFNIPTTHNLAQATSAKLLVHTWNGIDGQNTGTHYAKVNGWTAPTFGQDHYYSFNAVTVTTPITALIKGTNTVTFNSQSEHHGIEILWPGPSMLVRYSAKQP